MTLSTEMGQKLVEIARFSLEAFVKRKVWRRLNLGTLPDVFQENGASFVTLTRHTQLRGCLGSTVAKRPLAEDVAYNAVAAASRDPRFSPVRPEELPEIRLEVTILTALKPLIYTSYVNLLGQLRPNQDGILLKDGSHHGLLLPQMWARLPDPHHFVSVTARKAQIAPERLKLEPPVVKVATFQVQSFAEPGYREPG